MCLLRDWLDDFYFGVGLLLLSIVFVRTLLFLGFISDVAIRLLTLRTSCLEE
jgi:hypothetical protein